MYHPVGRPFSVDSALHKVQALSLDDDSTTKRGHVSYPNGIISYGIMSRRTPRTRQLLRTLHAGRSREPRRLKRQLRATTSFPCSSVGRASAAARALPSSPLTLLAGRYVRLCRLHVPLELIACLCRYTCVYAGAPPPQPEPEFGINLPDLPDFRQPEFSTDQPTFAMVPGMSCPGLCSCSTVPSAQHCSQHCAQRCTQVQQRQPLQDLSQLVPGVRVWNPHRGAILVLGNTPPKKHPQCHFSVCVIPIAIGTHPYKHGYTHVYTHVCTHVYAHICRHVHTDMYCLRHR